MRRLIVFFVLVSAASWVEAQGWRVSECPAGLRKEWTEYREALKKAEVGSHLYVPYPFPCGEAQVISDFEYTYLDILRHGDGKVEADEKDLARGVRGGTVTYEIVRVENWRLNRCSSSKPRTYYFLVRIRSRETGKELGRAALGEDGLLAGWEPASRDGSDLQGKWENAIPPLEAVTEKVRREYPLANATSRRYVATSGMVLCDYLSPCVAFNAGGREYLWDPWDAGLYEFEPETLEGVAEQVRKGSEVRRGLMSSLALASEERLISIGHEGMTIARKIHPPGR